MEKKATKKGTKNKNKEKIYTSMDEIRKEFFPELYKKEDKRELSEILLEESLEILRKHLDAK